MTTALHGPDRLSEQHPWPGLRPFTESDREFFFGREKETAELTDLVQRSTVVILYGQSGLGKTSLLQAGLLPRLSELGYLSIRVRFDHSDGAPPLAQQLKDAISSALDAANAEGPRPRADETLYEYFHDVETEFWGPRNRLLSPLIVLDQFEEVFTLGQRTEAASARVSQFKADLEALLEHRLPAAVRERLDAHPEEAQTFDLRRRNVKFLVSLREDFLADLDPWRERIPSLLQNRYRLESMTGSQALEVVELAGRTLVDPEVARQIVDFVSSSHRRPSKRGVEQRSIEPALLSLVCDELNRRRLEQGQARITADQLSGQREEIIRDFYARAFDGIDPKVRVWVEDELLTASGYRNRVALEDALEHGLPAADLNRLVDRRILHREERGVMWLELSHDLLTDPASESRADREESRRARRRRILLASGVVVALGLFLVLGWFYVEHLKSNIRQETSRTAANHVLTPVFGVEFSHDGKDVVTASADHTAKIWDAASGQLLHTLSGHSDWVNDAEFSPVGDRIVTASDDDTARLWEAESGHLRGVLKGHTDFVNEAEFSPDGMRIVTASDDDTARIWDGENGSPLTTLTGHTERVKDAKFSPDGKRVVTASADDTAKTWDAASGRLLVTLNGHVGEINSAEFSPDGKLVVTSSRDATARIWDADSGQLLMTLARHTAAVNDAEFSPDGERVVTASADHSAMVWDAASGRLLQVLSGHRDAVNHAEFSPDGALIVTASADHTAMVWDAASGQLLHTLAGHTDAVDDAAFSSDGRSIVTSSYDGTARVWDASSGRLLHTLSP